MGKPRAFIVDGYNIIRFPAGPYHALAEEDLDAARTRLVTDVAAYVEPGTDGVVVFDAYSNPRSRGTPHAVSGVTVIFSPYGVDADSVIEQQVLDRRRAGQHVTVVTSDAQTQWTVVGADVERMSAAGFCREVAGDHAERADFNPSGTTRSTLDRRVDQEVGERLARWARGEP